MSWLSGAILLVLAGQLNAFLFDVEPIGIARREEHRTLRLALAMTGAVRYPALLDLYTADGSKAKNVFMLISIQPDDCYKQKQWCPRNADNFTVLTKNDTHFFATAVLADNGDLNRVCEKGDRSRVSFVDYAGHLDSPIKFATLQVWYKCGVFYKKDAQRITVEADFGVWSWRKKLFVFGSFGMCGVLLVFFFIFTCRRVCRDGKNVERQEENNAPAPPQVAPQVVEKLVLWSRQPAPEALEPAPSRRIRRRYRGKSPGNREDSEDADTIPMNTLSESKPSETDAVASTSAQSDSPKEPLLTKKQ